MKKLSSPDDDYAMHNSSQQNYHTGHARGGSYQLFAGKAEARYRQQVHPRSLAIETALAIPRNTYGNGKAAEKERRRLQQAIQDANKQVTTLKVDFRNSSVMQSLSNDPGTAVNPTEQSSIQQDGHEDGQQLISPQYATGTAGVSVLDMQSLHYRSRVGLNE